MADVQGKCSEDHEGFMLFGVKVLTEGSFRKSASLSNLAQFDSQRRESNLDDAGGYDSDDVVYPSAGNRDRKKGVPWSEEEHRRFLLGLQRVGKGDWRGISRNYVKTRTPTQVASHAQKYFLRRSNHTRRRRRSSLFDITTDSVMDTTADEANPKSFDGFPTPSLPVAISPVFVPPKVIFAQPSDSPKPIRPIPILPPSSKLANLHLNKATTITPASPLPLSMPTPPSESIHEQHSSQQGSPARHASAFQAIPGAYKDSGGESIITVA